MTMSRLLPLVRAAAVAVVLASATLMPPAGVRASSSGSHVDLATTDARFGVDEAYQQADRADTLGARWSRIPFIWDYVQHDGPSSWNNFVLSSHGSDSVVNGELARGRSVVGELLGTPPWARQNAAWGEASVPINIDKRWNDPRNYWGAYCYKIARQFAGRINDWVIWNEVSIPAGLNGAMGLWTQWRGTPKQYARLLEVAYQAIHAANPRARIVLYGDPFWYDHGRYLTHLYNLLAAADPTKRYHGYFDVANLHLYSNPTDFYWIVRKVRALLASHGWGDKQIWISETNAEPYNGTTPPKQHTNFRVSMQAQAAFLVDAFASDLAAGVDRIEIYRMFDGVETAHGLPAWGLVNNAGQERPVARTFHFLVRLFKDAHGGSYTPGKLYGGKAGIFKVVVHKPGARITVLWNQDGARARYKLPAHATRATLYDKFGNARRITRRSGVYVLSLPGGHDFTNPFDPRIPTVGGDPAIVVERVH
ncbi:MAG TPA: hypothetical protein VJY65_04585 [Chloroflexota bacterium]|nr:hypothetical protein [Chloroflexota bacterium]